MASCTVKLLDSLSSSDDAFDAAFLAKCASPAIAFDCVVRVSLPSAGDAALSTADLPTWRCVPVVLGRNGNLVKSIQKDFASFSTARTTRHVQFR